MLPSSLLIVWKKKGVILPRYAKFDTEPLKVADVLIEAYKNGLGKKKKTLRKFVEGLEDSGQEYHFVRGLSFLLDRRSLFKGNVENVPLEIRRKIFCETGKSGPPTTSGQRRAVIEKIAAELKLSYNLVEEFMYADLSEELILEKFEPLSPKELLQKYNLSLTQTLMFDSTELEFAASGNWQRIFFLAKRLGLIYDAYEENGFWVKIDGPASLFKLTRRYGTAMAKLLPAIVANSEWKVKAKILWKYTNELCDFQIESLKHQQLFESNQLSVSYDSSVEENFATQFEALRSEWKLKREPEPVLAGKKVILPDFSFERNGTRIYMEIVGFWTKEYLMRKIEKLKTTKVNMLVAVDRALACERVSSLNKQSQLNVVYYKDRVPLAPVIQFLKQAFSETLSEQKKLLENLEVVLTEPFVEFEEFSKRIGVSADVARVVLVEKASDNYVLLANGLIRKDKFNQIAEEIDKQLDSSGRMKLPEAERITDKEGLAVTSVLEALGYKIVWHGIDAEKAEVIKVYVFTEKAVSPYDDIYVTTR